MTRFRRSVAWLGAVSGFLMAAALAPRTAASTTPRTTAGSQRRKTL